MDWNIWGPALLAVIASVGGTLLANAYFFGGLTQRVKQAEAEIEDLRDDGKSQWKQINAHGERVSKIEGRLNGRTIQ